MLAQTRQAMRVLEIVDAKHEGKLGDEYIKLAQAMILCTLPYSATKETKITRQARLGDGSTLYVTFSAAHPNVGMPFGADRKVLAWIFDKAIRTESPFIPWASAVEFQKEMGLTKGGKNNRDLNRRFERVAGLVINIQREAGEGKRDLTYPLIERSYLPSSITGKKLDNDMQQSLPELADRYGFAMNLSLFNDIRSTTSCFHGDFGLKSKALLRFKTLCSGSSFGATQPGARRSFLGKHLRNSFPRTAIPTGTDFTRGKLFVR